MAEVYAFTLQVGRNAPVSLVASLVDDIEAVTESAARLATHVARGEADNRVMNILRKGGIRSLVAEARRRELPGIFDRESRDLEEVERALEEWLHFPMGRRAEGFLLALMTPGRSYLPWSRLLDQLRAEEMSRLLPEDPYRFRSVRYGNPLGAEILVEAGAAATALAALLAVIRDWGPRRRQQNAIADDMEDLVRCKAKLRRMVLAKIASGELPISYDEVDDVISGRLAGAIDRLSDRQPEIEQAEDTDEDPDE
ncbi:hypothetical protein [Streptomyces avermitilis]|uniref:hypothetical protein n=1 Tax=Streptomyces avermitilis TaxID=33903 RepID=UPI0033CD6914